MGTYTSASYDEECGELARAWPRFWARMFDIVVYAMPAAFLLGMAFPSLFAGSTLSGPSQDYLTGMLVLPIVMVIDALVISQLGSSPGKAIAGLYVAKCDQERLGLETALKRNLFVYGRGLVLGIPLLCLIGYVTGYNAIKEDGLTSWDRDTETRVFCGRQ